MKIKIFDKLAVHQTPTPSVFPNMPEQSRMEQSRPEQSKMVASMLVDGKMVASMLVDGKMERRTERKKRHSDCLLSCLLHKMDRLVRRIQRSCLPFCLLSCLHRNEMELGRKEQQLRKNRRKMMILLEKRVCQKARQSQYHCSWRP